MVWLVLRDLPRVSAATRVAIWQVTLGVVLLLPLLQRITVPRWPESFVVEKTAVELLEAPLPRRPLNLTAGKVAASAPSTKVAPVFEFRDGQLFLAIAINLALFGLLRLGFSYWVIRRLKRRADGGGTSHLLEAC